MKLSIGPPNSSAEPPRDLEQARRLAQARQAGWPQLELGDLAFLKHGIVEHVPSGNLFSLHRGQLTDALYVTASAWFEDASGAIQYLEPPPPGPRTRAELEERQAEREQRRAQTTVPSWRR